MTDKTEARDPAPGDLAALERLARAATPGPWTNDRDHRGHSIIGGDGVPLADAHAWVGENAQESAANAAFIAAANPAAVLNLIGRVKELEAAVSSYEKTMQAIAADQTDAVLVDRIKVLEGALQPFARIGELIIQLRSTGVAADQGFADAFLNALSALDKDQPHAG